MTNAAKTFFSIVLNCFQVFVFFVLTGKAYTRVRIRVRDSFRVRVDPFSDSCL